MAIFGFCSGVSWFILDACISVCAGSRDAATNKNVDYACRLGHAAFHFKIYMVRNTAGIFWIDAGRSDLFPVHALDTGL